MLAEAAVEDFLRGINATIFAYGQTGTGKTYSMYGSEQALLRFTPVQFSPVQFTPVHFLWFTPARVKRP